MQLSEVSALATGIERMTRWLQRQTPRPMSSSALAALDRLATEGPLRVSDLASREGMTQPGVTILVNRLANSGHAERIADPTDGRAALVRITPDGRGVLAERYETRARILRDRLAQLSDEDQRLLAAALPAIERLAGIPDSGTTPTPAPPVRKSRS
jgi:DNA-binding MarR family transcriptional regulator